MNGHLSPIAFAQPLRDIKGAKTVDFPSNPTAVNAGHRQRELIILMRQYKPINNYRDDDDHFAYISRLIGSAASRNLIERTAAVSKRGEVDDVKIAHLTQTN